MRRLADGERNVNVIIIKHFIRFFVVIIQCHFPLSEKTRSSRLATVYCHCLNYYEMNSDKEYAGIFIQKNIKVLYFWNQVLTFLPEVCQKRKK